MRAEVITTNFLYMDILRGHDLMCTWNSVPEYAPCYFNKFKSINELILIGGLNFIVNTAPHFWRDLNNSTSINKLQHTFLE